MHAWRFQTCSHKLLKLLCDLVAAASLALALCADTSTSRRLLVPKNPPHNTLHKPNAGPPAKPPCTKEGGEEREEKRDRREEKRERREEKKEREEREERERVCV